MHVNTSIGEASAWMDGRDYLVRPSFAALNRIHDLQEAVRIVCEAYSVLLTGNMPRVIDIGTCGHVLAECSDFPVESIGYADLRGDRLKWIQGRLSVREVVIMAHHCIKWGIKGNPKEKLSKAARKRLADEPKRDFDPQEFVAVLVDEFGLSTGDAWNCTMVEFQRLCEQRQRKNWGDRPPPIDDEERDNLLAHYRACMQRKQELGNG